MTTAVILFVTTRKIGRSALELLLFWGVAVLEFPIQWLIYSHYGPQSALNGVITLALMILNVLLIVHRGYEDYLWKTLNFISILSSLCLILQMVCYWMGIRLDKIPFLSETFFKAWEFTNSFRACSLFSEPSHFAELALLSLYYYLLVKPRLRIAIVLALALILSTSNLGIIGVALLVVLYLLNLERYAHVRSSTKYIIITIAFLLGSGIMVWLSNSDNWVAVRLMSGGSSSVRIMRSFELYDVMDAFEKLFGIGIQNQEIYLNYHTIILPSDRLETITNREFSQTLGYILCTTGALGFSAFSVPFIRRILRSDYSMKCLCLLFFFVCLTCCIFSRHTFLLYLIAIYSAGGILEEKKS